MVIFVRELRLERQVLRKMHGGFSCLLAASVFFLSFGLFSLVVSVLFCSVRTYVLVVTVVKYPLCIFQSLKLGYTGCVHSGEPLVWNYSLYLNIHFYVQYLTFNVVHVHIFFYFWSCSYIFLLECHHIF
jgi:hypothetical protein